MKKKYDIQTTFGTIIKDISAIGNELSDEHLRLVSGGAKKGTCRRTKPASMTEPGKPDTAKDWESD